VPLATDAVRLAYTTAGDVEVPLRFAAGVEAVAQGCRDRVLAVKGEWFRDLDLGVRWRENDRVEASRAILGQRFNARKARSEIRAALLADPTEAVTEVLSIDVAFDGATRTMDVRWQVRCAFADTAVGGGATLDV
jgi:hypothetical protein